MLVAVFASTHEFQIARGVVRFVVVDVMDELVSLEEASQNAFHHKPVLSHGLVGITPRVVWGVFSDISLVIKLGESTPTRRE